MSTCRCLIIEDCPQTIKLLTEYLARIPYMGTPVVTSSLSEAISLLREPFDLLLLDIQLSDESRLDFMQAYPLLPPVIVTTSTPNFAVDCYDLDVSDYLLRPFPFSRFLRAVNRAIKPALRYVSPNESSIFLKVGHVVQRFDYADIDCIQAYGIYCKIIAGPKVTVVNEIISALELRLPAGVFMRVHKSYLINLKKVASYSHRTIFVGAQEVPLGTVYRNRFRAYLGLDKIE